MLQGATLLEMMGDYVRQVGDVAPRGGEQSAAVAEWCIHLILDTGFSIPITESKRLEALFYGSTIWTLPSV